MHKCNAQNRKCQRCSHRYWTDLPDQEQGYCPICNEGKNFLNYPDGSTLQGLRYLQMHNYLPIEYQHAIVADMKYHGKDVEEIFNNLSSYEFSHLTEAIEWKIDPYAYKKDSLAYKINACSLKRINNDE